MGDHLVARIYALVDPRFDAIRYVGLTTKSLTARLQKHVSHKGKTHRAKWVQSLVRQGSTPVIRLLEEVSLEKGFGAEKVWIKKFRALGYELVNLTDGGEGSLGLSPSVAARAKMRVAHLGLRPSLETRAKLRQVKLNQSEETRKKIGEANSRREVSLATRNKISVARLGKPLSAAHRAKLSAIGRRRKLTEEEKQKVREAALRRWAKWRAAQKV